jgi:predicted transcriptional regulator
MSRLPRLTGGEVIDALKKAGFVSRCYKRLGRQTVLHYNPTMTAPKRTIEVDADTADVLEYRAAESGVSVSDLLAELVARHGASVEVSSVDIAELDRQWAAIKAGEPTVRHEEVVRWLDTWGSPDFRSWHNR